MGNGMTSHGGADRFVHHVVDVRGPHDPLVVRGNIDIKFVQVHILLETRTDEVMEGMAGNREYGLAITLCVVEAIQ